MMESPDPPSDDDSFHSAFSSDDDDDSASSLSDSSVSSPRRRLTSISLGIQADEITTIQDLADFFQRIRQNLYAAIRVLLTHAELSRFYARKAEIRSSFLHDLGIYYGSRSTYMAARTIYKGQLEELGKSIKLMNLRSEQVTKAESTFLGMERVYQGATRRYNVLVKNYEDTLENVEEKKGKKIRRLKYLIRKAKVNFDRTLVSLQNYRKIWVRAKARYGSAYQRHKRVDKLFMEKDRKVYVEARTRHDLAYEEFERREQVYELEMVTLRQALRIVRFEHINMILRTVPLFQVNNREVEGNQLEEEQVEEQQVEEQQVEEQEDHPQQELQPETPEIIDWENLIYFQVELVIGFRTVTLEYF